MDNVETEMHQLEPEAKNARWQIVYVLGAKKWKDVTTCPPEHAPIALEIGQLSMYIFQIISMVR